MELFDDDCEISNEDFYLPILEDNNNNLDTQGGYTVFDYTFNYKEIASKIETT